LIECGEVEPFYAIMHDARLQEVCNKMPESPKKKGNI